jgi:hypothetical protein
MEMTIYDPDAARFTRAGRPLEHWLMQLLDADLNRRKRAATFIGKMHCETDELTPDTDVEAYMARFEHKVQEVLNEPQFDTRAYVRGLVETMRLSSEQHDRLWKQEQARADRVSSRITAKLEAARDDAERDSLTRRLLRTSCASMDCRTPTARERHKHSLVDATAAIVFRSIGEHAHSEPATIRRMLGDPRMEHQALMLLSKSQRGASAFYDDLLAKVDDVGDHASSVLLEALANSVAGDPDRMREVFQMAVSEADGRSGVMLQVLAEIGPPMLSAVPDAPAQLAELALDSQYRGTLAATALGKMLARKRDRPLPGN